MPCRRFVALARPRVANFIHRTFHTPCTLKTLPPRRNPIPWVEEMEEVYEKTKTVSWGSTNIDTRLTDMTGTITSTVIYSSPKVTITGVTSTNY